MDIAIYEESTINITSELSKVGQSDRDRAIDRFRKIAEKGAITCPFCGEKLLLRAGQVRDVHFAHLPGKTCLESEAYETYQNQIKRENKKHSVIKEIIYNELKSQEKIKPDLKVEYGYKEKSLEKWKHYPDIYLNKNGREFAVSVLTNVHEIGDEQVVKAIKKRNAYFTEKGLEPIWFVEDRELAEDRENRVVHLWEAEYDLAIKTVEDRTWDRLLTELKQEFPDHSLFGMFNYKARGRLMIDTKSLYYVHSVGDDINFSVYRMILDDKKQPFRAFYLSEAYKMNISNALIVRDEILLSDPEQEDKNRSTFANEYLLLVQAHEEQMTQMEDEQDHEPELAKEHIEVIKPKTRETVEQIDVIEYLKKLKYIKISESEAKKLYQYLRVHRNELEDYGLTFKQMKQSVTYALGKIQDPKIRTWLVDIEYLS